jgi:hypothetical protein
MFAFPVTTRSLSGELIDHIVLADDVVDKTVPMFACVIGWPKKVALDDMFVFPVMLIILTGVIQKIN